MLNAYPIHGNAGTSLATAAWVDLVSPTDAEISAFEQAFGLRVPTQDKLSEIETTSHLRVEHEALYLSAPLIVAAENEPWIPAPTGFVLSKRVLIPSALPNRRPSTP